MDREKIIAGLEKEVRELEREIVEAEKDLNILESQLHQNYIPDAIGEKLSLLRKRIQITRIKLRHSKHKLEKTKALIPGAVGIWLIAEGTPTGGFTFVVKVDGKVWSRGKSPEYTYEELLLQTQNLQKVLGIPEEHCIIYEEDILKCPDRSRLLDDLKARIELKRMMDRPGLY